MKAEQLFETISGADPELLERSEREADRSFITHRKVLIGCGTIAACMLLLFTVFIPKAKKGSADFELSDESHNVTVSYTENALTVNASYDLVYYSEEELFSVYDTTIVKGEVTQINNIEIDFNGDKEYRAIADILVNEVYRGKCKSGDIISVLLPCSIATNVWVEDTGVISSLRVGTTGIFMPITYDENSYIAQNDAKLMLTDITAYGMLDGERFAFLKTEQGMIFARYAYPSIEDAATLEEVEAFVKKMIQ